MSEKETSKIAIQEKKPNFNYLYIIIPVVSLLIIATIIFLVFYFILNGLFSSIGQSYTCNDRKYFAINNPKMEGLADIEYVGNNRIYVASMNKKAKTIQFAKIVEGGIDFSFEKGQNPDLKYVNDLNSCFKDYKLEFNRYLSSEKSLTISENCIFDLSISNAEFPFICKQN